MQLMNFKYFRISLARSIEDINKDQNVVVQEYLEKVTQQQKQKTSVFLPIIHCNSVACRDYIHYNVKQKCIAIIFTGFVMIIIYNLMQPFLLDGFKIDLRVYVLVSSYNPLRIFVYKDGLVRNLNYH